MIPPPITSESAKLTRSPRMDDPINRKGFITPFATNYLLGKPVGKNDIRRHGGSAFIVGIRSPVLKTRITEAASPPYMNSPRVRKLFTADGAQDNFFNQPISQLYIRRWTRGGGRTARATDPTALDWRTRQSGLSPKGKIGSEKINHYLIRWGPARYRPPTENILRVKCFPPPLKQSPLATMLNRPTSRATEIKKRGERVALSPGGVKRFSWER